jgi:NADH-quinone oxidoreductase subunit M
MNILFLIIAAVLLGALSFGLKNNNNKLPAYFTLLLGIAGIAISTQYCFMLSNNDIVVSDYYLNWLPEFGAKIAVHINGLGAMLCLLTSICFVLITLSTFNKNIKNPHQFFGFILLSFAGLLGVFVAWDALMFYFFWELALIPVYFLCSMWGAEDRVKVSFKFFIYTFVGSLIMLIGLMYMYSKTPDHSFAWASFAKLKDILSLQEQKLAYLLMFIAFAIKMPIFPLHTWQPATYNSTLTPVTMILSAVMVKMGLFALTRWLNPILPDAAHAFTTIITILCIIGIVYASLLAMAQKNIKKLVAYSSIAHIGLMCAALFSFKDIGILGASVQMFHHGINIIGMWMLVYFAEEKFGTKNMNEMGGIAAVNPLFAIFLVIVTLANVALPLTNAFAGEFMMFNGIFNNTFYAQPSWINLNILFTVLAGLGIIFGAVYSLKMIQQVAFGQITNSNINEQNAKFTTAEIVALSIVVLLILFFGIHPQPLINLVNI